MIYVVNIKKVDTVKHTEKFMNTLYLNEQDYFKLLELTKTQE